MSNSKKIGQYLDRLAADEADKSKFLDESAVDRLLQEALRQYGELYRQSKTSKQYQAALIIVLAERTGQILAYCKVKGLTESDARKMIDDVRK